jgi:hypothetical protein
MTIAANGGRATRAPRVSVLVPCYNLGAFLDEAVSSVLDQTFQDFEILIVDDGSTDAATVRLLEEYARPRTTVFRTRNHGLAAARNFLVALARGEYLCALDADDVLHPRYLERTVAALDANPSLGFASTKLQMFGQEATVWPDRVCCDLATLLCHDPVHCAALVRRQLVLEAGGYDQTMGHQGNEDWDLWIGITERGHPGTILDEVLFSYRRREGSMSRHCTRGVAHLEAVAFLLRKHAASYERFSTDVAQWKEHRLAVSERRNETLTGQIAATVETLARHLAELDTLRTRVRAKEGPVAMDTTSVPREAALARELRAQIERAEASEAACRSALAEIEALRSSLSWRVTSPLRAAYGQVTGASRSAR